MWTLTTSTGRRVIGIACERDARWAVHSLGITEVVSPYVWRVRDNQGQQFIAQLTKERLTRKTKGTPVSPPRGDFLREGFSGSLRQRSVSADTLGLESPSRPPPRPLVTPVISRLRDAQPASYFRAVSPRGE